MGGGGGAPATQTITNKTELPAWLEGITKENLALADKIASRPYQAYPGQMTAGFAPEQEAAFNYMAQGVGMTDPLYGRAANVTNEAAGYNPQDVQAGSFLSGNIGAYMNPYINNVEQAALSRLEGATKLGLNRLGDQARAAGAFGGSRQGIAEGVALGEASKSAGELSANLRSQAFQQAAALQQADQQRAMQAALANQTAGLQGANLRLNAANQLGTLAGNAQQARFMDASALENIGMQRQAQQQAALDEAYARFAEERNYPIDMLNLRLGATSSTPYGGTQTQTGPAQRTGSSGLMTGLGAAATVASLGASLATIF